MDKPTCVINPKTKRAVKADSKLGKQILGGNFKKEPVKPAPKPKKEVPKPKKEVKPEPKKEVKPEPKKEAPKPKKEVKPEPKKEAPKPEPKIENDIDDLVNEIDSYNFLVLMYQKSIKNKKIDAMIKKIEYLVKKNYTVVPSDLFSFYPEFLNALIDKYGASVKTLNMINDNMIDFIKSINDEALIPDEFEVNEMKYFTKYMNSRNKNKFSFLDKKK